VAVDTHKDLLGSILREDVVFEQTAAAGVDGGTVFSVEVGDLPAVWNPQAASRVKKTASPQVDWPFGQ
jgi:hypothetical protein